MKMYQKSLLAREISSYLDLTYIVVYDVLDELEYTAQMLGQKDVMKWVTRVEKVVFNLR